ncbi:MAG TPA: ATP-binding protein [Candidatus Methanoperedens sp.]|nr:ATP-binding protein [Candidatus Methanoperedens sp.]
MVHENILVVEDEAIVAEDIKNVLLMEGYFVCATAPSGDAAIKKVHEYHPDLILMDINLKGNMDGIETSGKIREQFDIPIIYLTAFSEKNTIDRAKLTNPMGYIVKPINRRDLCIAIEITIYKHRADKKINEEKTWLNTTLKSISDAVVATDPQGRVKFMNPVARSFSKCATAQFEGKSITELFDIRIKNPGTGSTGREAVETELVINNNLKIPIDIKSANIVDEIGNKKGIVMVFRDISEQKKNEMELKKINNELMKANEIKKQFLSVISHELRTPLTPMKAQIQMILAGYLGEITDKQRPSFEMLNRNTLRLDRLIGDVLDISKLEAGVMKLNMSKVDLYEIVKNVVETMKPQVEAKNIKLTLRGDRIPEIYADSDRFTQVVMNFIDNAFKFTDNGGCIEVEISKDNDNAFIKVKDNGIGIKKEDQDNIFDPFVQIDSSYSRKHEGTGLGLAICRGIVKFHGGKIWLESEFGKGCTFYISIPFEQCQDKNTELKILGGK